MSNSPVKTWCTVVCMVHLKLFCNHSCSQPSMILHQMSDYSNIFITFPSVILYRLVHLKMLIPSKNLSSLQRTVPLNFFKFVKHYSRSFTTFNTKFDYKSFCIFCSHSFFKHTSQSGFARSLFTTHMIIMD